MAPPNANIALVMAATAPRLVPSVRPRKPIHTGQNRRAQAIDRLGGSQFFSKVRTS